MPEARGAAVAESTPQPQQLLHPDVARELERIMNPTPQEFAAAIRDVLPYWHGEHPTIQ